MRSFLTLLLVVALPFTAAAQQAVTTPAAPGTPAPAKPGTVIIDGKKFFSLAGARRFNGDPNSPSALQVVHHPKPAGFSARHIRTLPMAQSEDGSAAKASSNTVLSVFAPTNNVPAPLP